MIRIIDKEISKDNKFIKNEQGILLFKGLIYIPISKRIDIVQQHHNIQNIGY